MVKISCKILQYMASNKIKDIGIYVHIPFCKQKCYYCDFISYANKKNLIDRYVNVLIKEIIDVAEGNRMDYENNLDSLFNVNTIYIGGGTPSFIDSKYIVKILNTIKQYFKLSNNIEITLEVNPGTLDEKKLKNYFEAGVNRLSIGLQTTNDELLKEIGRIHTYNDFINTYSLARKVGFKNINADLIIGLPKQTIEDVEKSVNSLIKLGLEHLSVYSLILEEGTVLEEKVRSGKLNLPEDEEERNMYWKVKKILEKNSYKHYEISNFAKNGYESKHNLDCWNQKEYIGFGASAHSYTNGVRYSNIDNLEKYIENYENDKEVDNFVFHEKQTHNMKVKEYMMLGLRKIDGVCIQDFKEKFAANPIYVFKEELEKLVNEELIEIDGDYIKLTNKGIDLANLVWEEFV
jgi:oxygen-independent coproporphyrinogen-3 oxidase